MNSCDCTHNSKQITRGTVLSVPYSGQYMNRFFKNMHLEGPPAVEFAVMYVRATVRVNVNARPPQETRPYGLSAPEAPRGISPYSDVISRAFL